MGRKDIYSIKIIDSKQRFKIKTNTKCKLMRELSNHYLATY